MAKPRTTKKTTRAKYPKKPTAEDRERQFDQPPVEMPEGMTATAAKIAEAEGDDEESDQEERSWSQVKKGATPEKWQIMEDGVSKTAGGPIKHSLCPGCIHLSKEGTCSSSMNEETRNNPATVGCPNAKRLDGKYVG